MFIVHDENDDEMKQVPTFERAVEVAQDWAREWDGKPAVICIYECVPVQHMTVITGVEVRTPLVANWELSETVIFRPKN